MTDLATVIEGMKRKDHKAFQIMVNHYSARLMTVAKIYAKNTYDAEDILQDAFITVFMKISRFQLVEEKMFYAWTKRIVVNTALAKYRRKYFTHEKFLALPMDVVGASEIDKQHESDAILSYIYDLPLKYREVIGLYALEGFSHKEIADKLKIKESTSRSIYSRGTTKLKKMMRISNKLIS